ncbi:hypothetical protein AB1303_14660 [Saccharolobus solfataricus]|uniref:Uncharacterized protein n=1 Tax=Saccharolobus solfataricus TaxID=2287 RepID=A0A7S9NSG8_SACSO|nr:hypothetical protein [Saccharolobus solfataricus]QPG51178.1 hypothetical protein HFC64_16310 [Saccharolobus solfataricus]
MLRTYTDLIRDLSKVKYRYRAMAIANFLDKAASFFSGKTAGLLEEVIYYYRMEGEKEVKAKNVTNNVYARLEQVIKEIEELLDSAKEAYRLENIIKRSREIMIYSLVLAILSLIVSGAMALYPSLFTIPLFLFFNSLESLLFIIFVMSYVFISKEISQIRKDLSKSLKNS